MTKSDLPDWFVALLHSVTAKRPRTVIDHILAHGQVTTEELRDLYGYSHPPRAARDVRELGIPLETFRVEGSDGRQIAAYRFGDPSQERTSALSGRTVATAQIKDDLLRQFGAQCNISLTALPPGDLQVDHRIPFGIAGEQAEPVALQQYQLLSPSANRAKSWSCQHCPNWTQRDQAICASCYWAAPERYSHVATQQVRRLDLIWSGAETADFDQLAAEAEQIGTPLPEFVKQVLRRHLSR